MSVFPSERQLLLSRLATLLPPGDDLNQIERVIAEGVAAGAFDDVLPTDRLLAWIEDLREYAHIADEDITSWLTIMWTLRARQNCVLRSTKDDGLLHRWADAWIALAERMRAGWDEGWSVSIADECLDQASFVYGRLLAVHGERELRAGTEGSARGGFAATSRNMGRVARRRADGLLKIGRVDHAEQLLEFAAMTEAVYGTDDPEPRR